MFIPSPTSRPARWALGALLTALVVLPGLGCLSPYVARPSKDGQIARPARGKGPDLSEGIRVASPREQVDRELVSPGSSVETWVIHTRACDQNVVSNPWPSLTVARVDEFGGPLHGDDPETLIERMAGRPVVVLIHGNGYTYRDAVKEGIEVRAKLEAVGGFAPDSLFLIFDWPSERMLRDLVIDLNEKARRSRVAGYHLARVLQTFPPGSRVCLLGQSDGGRIVLTATHLISGAELPRFLREPAVQLETGRRDLRIRCVTLDAAAAHNWLDPGFQLQEALPTCEALLNLPNRRDYALAVFTFGRYTGSGGAIGRVGLNFLDRKRLGPLMEKVEEIDHHRESGLKHTLFTRALTYPEVARRIAAYSSWGDIGPGRVTRRGHRKTVYGVPEAKVGGPIEAPAVATPDVDPGGAPDVAPPPPPPPAEATSPFTSRGVPAGG